MTANLPAVDAERFWKQGYLHLRGVFAKEEIAEYRAAAEKLTKYEADLLSHPVFRKYVLDDRVLHTARTILGGKPVYYGDSNLMIGDGSFGYHKDNADRDNINAPDWTQGRYTIIRFGLYLQDHSRHSGGLNILAESHNDLSAFVGRSVYVQTEPGDLVVWNLRTNHSGSGRLLWFPRSLHLRAGIARKLPAFLFRPPERHRYAMFASYGLDDHHLKRYIKYLTTRTYQAEIWRSSKIDDDVRQAAAGKDVEIRDVWPMVKDDPQLGCNPSHRDIPF
jgi:hypothetical protein